MVYTGNIYTYRTVLRFSRLLMSFSFFVFVFRFFFFSFVYTTYTHHTVLRFLLVSSCLFRFSFFVFFCFLVFFPPSGAQVPAGEGIRPGNPGPRGLFAAGARGRHALPRGARSALRRGDVLRRPLAEAGAAQPDLRGPGERYEI